MYFVNEYLSDVSTIEVDHFLGFAFSFQKLKLFAVSQILIVKKGLTWTVNSVGDVVVEIVADFIDGGSSAGKVRVANQGFMLTFIFSVISVKNPTSLMKNLGITM